MSEESPKSGVDRRNFLKSMAAGTAGAGVLVAASGAAGAAGGAKPQGGSEAQAGKLIPRPGSDFMVDVIKTLGIDYIAANPGSSFRSLHESVVNYGGNRKPELTTCLHEETAVAIAHGYAKAAGKPMAVMRHGTVGLQHGSMAIYNAWYDRVPILMFAGNGVDAVKRRPGHRVVPLGAGRGGDGARLHQLGRPADVAAAFRRVQHACLQDRQYGSEGAGTGDGRPGPAGERDRA